MRISELEDPQFCRWLESQFSGPIKPDARDFDVSAKAHTEAERAKLYRLAQARKVMRLYRAWKASQN